MKENPQKQKINGNRRLLDKDKFRFECHPGVTCFSRYCRNADMYLYPYDIVRLKKILVFLLMSFLKNIRFQLFGTISISQVLGLGQK